MGHTNYNLYFTGVGQNARWFPSYVGQFREWVGQTITSISLPCRTKCSVVSSLRWTISWIGQTNYYLNFTGVGQNIRWFAPYVGQFREWVRQTITSISLASDRMSGCFLPTLDNFVNGSDKVYYYNLNFTGVGQNVRLFPPHVGQFREWVGQWPCPTDILRYSIQSIIRKNRGV